MKHIIIFLFVCATGVALAQDNVAWHDVTQWGVEGRAWEDQERKRWFDRFLHPHLPRPLRLLGAELEKAIS